MLAVKPTLTNLTRFVAASSLKIWIKSSASTAASQPLTQVSNTGSEDRFDFRVRNGTGSHPASMTGLLILVSEGQINLALDMAVISQTTLFSAY